MDYPQLNLNKVEGPKATIKTNHGDIKIQLFPEQAPMTVENFVRLAQKGYYDKTIFHRVISDFMIQGGDPEGNGTGGTSIWDHPFEDEFSQELFNLRFQQATGNLEKPSRIRDLRHTVARMKTVLKEREINE